MTQLMNTTPPSPRPWLSGLTPYVPGEPAAEIAGSLASNENPIGATPAIGGALLANRLAPSRYPDALASELVSELAAIHGIDERNILVGNGSDELIQLLVIAYAAFGGTVSCAEPSYQLHEKLPRMLGATVVKTPLNDWRHDLRAMREVRSDLAFICNPHNPTGTVVSREEILDFARSGVAALTVVDEAYIEYADDSEHLTLVGSAARGETAVLRTFSKFYGLAGLRVGYLVAHEEIIEVLRAIRLPFGVNSVAQAAAIRALRDEEHCLRVLDTNRRMREALTGLFRRAGYEVIPSAANFILVLTERPGELIARLGHAGISVRPGASLGIEHSVRISVPSEEGMRKFSGLF